ncbi:unnamed protein product [Brachionus calyciflorus]|uniref:CCHC-type domain-containing protein n=1 Tax=Brachionus calyciflorus TaxID=104777 RepID=A0A813N9P6_9BILA|nr:unnamed protein product [Brachionus calyciflorus]
MDPWSGGNHDLQDVNSSFSTENRQQKRSIENISPTKSDDDNSKRNRYDNKTIAPILYFKLDEKYVKSKKELNSIIATCFGDEFDIQTKITANGNLLLGITGDQVSEFKEDFFKFGIKNVVPIKNRDGRQLRICKIEIDSEENRERFLRDGKILIGNEYFRVELLAKQPIRCLNCKRLGHTMFNCNFKSACGKCNSPDHFDKDCTSCSVYKREYRAQINSEKKSSKSGKNEENLSRSYSQLVSNNSLVENFNNKFDEFSKKIDEKLANFEKALSNQEEKIKLALNSKVNEINGQISILKDTLNHYKKNSLLFQLDLFKVLNPNLPKLSNEISNIHKLYNNHFLNQDNNLSLAELSSYLTKHWSKVNNAK